MLIAYASGHLMARRTLPLGREDVVDLMLTRSLRTLGIPAGVLDCVVVTYRGLDLVPPAPTDAAQIAPRSRVG